MIKYIIKRLLWLIPVLICVAFVIFTLLYFTPGDPVEAILGEGATVEQMAIKRAELGLDDPYIVQLLRFFKQLFVDFNLGKSYVYGNSVMGQLMQRLPRTAAIAAVCCVLQLVIAVPLGVTAAVHQNGFTDRFCILLAIICNSIPNFWFAMILVVVFSLQLKLLPSSGIGHWYNYIMPCIAGCLTGVGGVARQTRSQMLEVIRSDYIVTARAQGHSESTIRYRYALPNALVPVITSVGTYFGRTLGGTVVIETVFSIPGIGMYLVEAVGNRDYPAVRGSVVVLAILFSMVMLLVDLCYAFIDPRVKAQYENQKKKKVKTNV